MRKEIREYKKQLIVNLWAEKKGTWTMDDLAGLFGCSVAWIYAVLKEARSKIESEHD
jgi:hypothetical protein